MKTDVLLELPEWVLDLLVVEGVNGNLGDNVSEGDHEEGEQEQHNGVDEGVECQCQQHHQTHPQDHRTQLYIIPVDDIEG